MTMRWALIYNCLINGCSFGRDIMFIKKIEKDDKTVFSFCGIKFVQKNEKKSMDLYNKNRFYNNIIKEKLPYSLVCISYNINLK